METIDITQGEKPVEEKEEDALIAGCRVEELLLLDPKQFADIFGLDVRSERRWRQANTVPHINIRGRIYYTLADVREALKNFKRNTNNLNLKHHDK